MSDKKRRTVISLATKLEILKRLESGEGSTYVGRIYGLQESTIRSIKKKGNAIRSAAKATSGEAAKKLYKVRNIVLEQTEQELAAWVRSNGVQTGKKEICQNASKIYEQKLAHHRKSKTYELSKKHKFSTGWYEAFLKRHSLRQFSNEEGASEKESNIAAGKSTEPQSTKKEICDFDENFVNIEDDNAWLSDIQDDTNDDKLAQPSKEADMTDLFCGTLPKNSKSKVNQEVEPDYPSDADTSDSDEEMDEVLSDEKVKEGLDMALKLEKHFIVHDPDLIRLKTFLKAFKKCMKPYEKLIK